MQLNSQSHQGVNTEGEQTRFHLIQQIKAWRKQHPCISFFVPLGVVYTAYYFLRVVRRPVIACKDGKLRLFLFRHCPIFNEKYWPTFWCFGARSMTLVRGIFQSTPSGINYRNDLLKAPDGGELMLHWEDNEKSHYTDTKTRPTVLLLPAVAGSRKSTYIMHLVKRVKDKGYRCVVLNGRGYGGAKLVTPKLPSFTSTDDLEFVVKHIKSKYPESPLMAAGLCQGGHSSVFEKHFDLDHILQSTDLRDFEDRFTSKVYGYPTFEDYCKDVCIHEKCHQIEIPLLCLNAADDMFAPKHSIPIREAEKSDHMCIVVTSRGGHIGFCEGFFPRHETYLDRMFIQYVDAMFKYGHKELANINT